MAIGVTRGVLGEVWTLFMPGENAKCLFASVQGGSKINGMHAFISSHSKGDG